MTVVHAWEVPCGWPARPDSPAKRKGLRYESLVGAALRLALPQAQIYHNPWFKYQTNLPDGATPHICSPDYVVICSNPLLAFIAEVKLTYTPLALAKLESLYIPCVSLAWQSKLIVSFLPLVICYNLIPGVTSSPTLSDALASTNPLLFTPRNLG